MGVVQLNGDLVWEGGEVVTDGITAAKFRCLESSDDILQSGSAQEVLLFETEVLALGNLKVFRFKTAVRNLIGSNYCL